MESSFWIWTYLFLTLTTIHSATGEGELIITTANGPVLGITKTTALGRNVTVFYGIPYAQPPLANLRFRHPRPVQNWTDVLNATIPPESCYQRSFGAVSGYTGLSQWLPNTALSEDCLKLNIFVPEHSWSSRLAVMVFIHGGGFSTGSAMSPAFDGSILASEEGVIYVSINYRLASLGFLYLEDQDVPGNAGLYDQVMALEWIRKNIGHFGGDKDRITIFGQSAGAASVAFHLLSSMSRHLFARAILESGGPTSPWALMNQSTSLEEGYKLVDYMDCRGPNVTAIGDCLRSKDAEELILNEPIRGYADVFVFRPIIDGIFIAEDPKNTLGKRHFKRCNILLGTNRNEASIFIMGLLPHVFPFTKNEVRVSHDDVIQTAHAVFPEFGATATRAVEFQYTDWLDPENSNKNLYSSEKLMADSYFTCPAKDLSDSYAEAGGSKIFRYFFIHRSSNSPMPAWIGTYHAEEIQYVFGYPLDPEQGFSEDEKAFSKRLMRYWANFAKTGNPNISEDGKDRIIHWPPYTRKGKEYLVLAPNSTSVGMGLREKYCAFWNMLIPYLQTIK